jgi:Ser/Thr protein kinase RdoA (MazF antagonist)
VSRADVLSYRRCGNRVSAAFRLECAAGEVVKGRRTWTRGDARRITNIVAHLDSRRFQPVLAHRGSALLEQWVHGPCVRDLFVGEDLLVDGGRLLGSLHAVPAAPAAGDGAATLHGLTRRLAQRLTHLGEAFLRPHDAAALLALARRTAPAAASAGFIHRDLCPENLVLRDAALCSVDNGLLTFGFHDLDLARTAYRWPLERRAFDVLLYGYRPFRDPSAFLRHRAFWTIYALAGAAIRLIDRRDARGAPPLEVLRERLHEELE